MNPRLSDDDASAPVVSTSQAHWVVPLYLAAHGTTSAAFPSYEELGLVDVIEAGKRCADFRGHGRHLVLPIEPLPLDDSPWRELFGLAGSIGESLIIAAACEVEVELHRRARACGDLPPQMLLGQRFLSIAQGQEVLSIGHRLANLVVRAVAIDVEIRVLLADESCRSLCSWTRTHTPFSTERDAWISLNRSNAGRIERSAGVSRHPSIRALASVLTQLVGAPEWAGLEEARGRDFHRWRPESSVLTGIDRQSGHVREIRANDGRVVGHSYGAESVRYSGADQIEDQIAQLAGAALRCVAGATGDALTQLGRALEPLSRGHLIVRSEAVSTRFGYEWEEDDCTCCT